MQHHVHHYNYLSANSVIEKNSPANFNAKACQVLLSLFNRHSILSCMVVEIEIGGSAMILAFRDISCGSCINWGDDGEPPERVG